MQPARRLCTLWSGWWQTSSFSTTLVSVANTATPNSGALLPCSGLLTYLSTLPCLPALTQTFSASTAWAVMLRCTVNFTADLTFSSCLRAKATTMKGLVVNSTRSSGPTRRWTRAPKQPETPLTPIPSHHMASRWAVERRLTWAWGRGVGEDEAPSHRLQA